MALKLCSALETLSLGAPPFFFFNDCGPSVTLLITGTVYLTKAAKEGRVYFVTKVKDTV